MKVFKFLSGLALAQAGLSAKVYMGCTQDGLECIKISKKKQSLGLEVFARKEYEYRRSDMPEDPLFFLFPGVHFKADDGKLVLDLKSARGSLYHVGTGEVELLRSADDMLSILRSDMSLNRELSGRILSGSKISLMGIEVEEQSSPDWVRCLSKGGVKLSAENVKFFRKLATSSLIDMTGSYCRARPLQVSDVYFGCEGLACARIEMTGRQTARIERVDLEGKAVLFFPSVKLALDEKTGALISAVSRETPGLIYGLESATAELMTGADTSGYVCRESLEMFGLRLNKVRDPVDWVSVLREKGVGLSNANLGFLNGGFSHALKKLTEKALADADCKLKQVARGSFFACGGYHESCFEIDVVSDSEMTLTGVFSEGLNFGTNRWLVFYPRLKYSYHKCVIRVIESEKGNLGFMYNLVSNNRSKVSSLNALMNSPGTWDPAKTPLEFSYRGNAMQHRQLGADLGFELKALERRQLWLDTARRRGWKLSGESELFLVQPMLNVFDDVYDAQLSLVPACASSQIPMGAFAGFLTPNWKIKMQILSGNKMDIRVRTLTADQSLAVSRTRTVLKREHQRLEFFSVDYTFDGSKCELNFPSGDFTRNFKLAMKGKASRDDRALHHKADNFDLTAIYSNMQTLTFMNSLLVFVPPARAE